MNTKSKRQAKGGRRNIILGSDFKATQFWSFCWLESNTVVVDDLGWVGGIVANRKCHRDRTFV